MDAGKVRRDVLEARMRNYAQPFLEIGACGVGACLDPKRFIEALLAGKPVDKVYESAAWMGKTVVQRMGAVDFRYRESTAGNGIRTTSALFWKARE